jgi:hypothetical protein
MFNTHTRFYNKPVYKKFAKTQETSRTGMWVRNRIILRADI